MPTTKSPRPWAASGALVALSPILLIQGLWARARTPRLPEAAGPRAGRVDGGTRAVRVLFFGDSSMAGVGAATQAESLPSRSATAMAQTHRVSVQWSLRARTGLTSESAYAFAQTERLPIADAVVIALGVNDVTKLRSPIAFVRDYDRLLRYLLNETKANHVVLCGLPPMGLLPALPQPLRWCLGREAGSLDAALATYAAGHAHFTHLPLPLEEFPPGTAVDGFHPGPAQYLVWAQHVAAALGATQTVR